MTETLSSQEWQETFTRFLKATRPDLNTADLQLVARVQDAEGGTVMEFQVPAEVVDEARVAALADENGAGMVDYFQNLNLAEGVKGFLVVPAEEKLDAKFLTKIRSADLEALNAEARRQNTSRSVLVRAALGLDY